MLTYETVTLKTPLVFRVQLAAGDPETAFTSRAFVGVRETLVGETPQPRDHVRYAVREINIDSTGTPWYALLPGTWITIAWGNVLSIQQTREPARPGVDVRAV